MLLSEPATWIERIEWTLERYDEPLLRQVSAQLFRPRNQWPVEELVARNLATVGNAAAIDRRLQTLEPASRRVLALIGHSRQPRWRLGSLIEMLAVLEHGADTRPVLALLETGLLYPVLPDTVTRLRDFEHWLTLGGANGPEVFAPPEITARAIGEDLGLPACPGETAVTGGSQEADGLEWPLRLTAVWQQVAAGPLRRTQQGEFFKRDFERLRDDPLLSVPPADNLTELPQRGLLAVEWALALGVLRETNGEISAAGLPPAWNQGLSATLASLWSVLPHLESWNPEIGWQSRLSLGRPYLSAPLLTLLLLARLPRDAWADPRAVAAWVADRHPFWTPTIASTAENESLNGDNSKLKTQNSKLSAAEALARFLLGVAYDLRMVQAAKDAQGAWAIRLSPLGRSLLGLGGAPAEAAAYPQTLLVQPNLEIVAYRQGLTPALIAHLGQFAAWKSFGSACTLQLQPETVYRALEAGQSFETIRRTLDQHGMRPTPPAVIESLRTWSNKRERLGVYAAATLFEFASAEDLTEALARGLPATRLSERLAVVPDESAIDFRQFRLTGTRDYALPPEQCVEVGDDGVTLTVDLAKSDLLLETELQRFAESAGRPDSNGRRAYVLTPASLAAARANGLPYSALENWFLQRTGQSPSPAAALLLTGDRAEPLTVQRQLILNVPEPAIADGLMQWPPTRALIQTRLGPTVLAVDAAHVEELSQRLRPLGLTVTWNEPDER
jgi:hypothetical protein